ncbi:MAG TPA: RNA polymerase sigma factor [Steroidobacteraceae bacterium]
MTDNPEDDAELLGRLGEGDAGAARELYQRYGAALLRFGIAMTSSRQMAEDIVHDTFVELLRNPASFNPAQGTVGAWLYGIARHRLARLLRANPLATAVGDAEMQQDEQEAAASLPSAEEEIDRVQLIERVRKAILDLPLAHREIIALCELEELPYATVAMILDCPIGTVRSRLHRARALLAIRLGSKSDAHNPSEEHETPLPVGRAPCETAT